MASIPTYQPDQVQQEVVTSRQQSIASPDLFMGMTQANNIDRAAQGVSTLGSVVEKHALELQAKEDTAYATDAEAKFLTAITDYKVQSRQRQGLNANGLPDEADKFFNDTAKATIDSAPNERVKQALTNVIAKQLPGFRGYIGAHAAEQLDKAAEDGVNAQINSQINAAAADPAQAATSRGRVVAAINALGVTKGWDKETTDAAIMAKTTELHTSVINSLLVNAPKQAQAYFAQNKDEIAGEQQTKIANHLKATIDANDAIEGADTVWSKFGPKADGQPVQLDIMEAEVRKMYAGDAGKIKETIGELRSRASAFNSSENERTATNVNKVMDAYASGTSLAKLKAMPEYLALPGDRKAAIADHIDAKQQSILARRDAADARADAAEQRAERNRQKKAYSAYLAYSNPEVLNGMTENQIIAMIPDIGEDKAGSLMSMKRSLAAKPEKLVEAKMDTEDFNHIANGFGFHPYKKEEFKTEGEKAALGELRFKVEHIIDRTQAQLKRPLSRQEKNDLMRNEMARTVTVDPGLFSAERQVPVIQMDQNQVDRVVIPAAERKAAAARLQKLRQRFPNDPAYEPTERNLRMLYLQSISPNADLINGN
jgi:hypothetical protein